MTTLGPAPGYAKHPNHSIVLAQDTARVIVRWRGLTLASSAQAITLRETGYEPVYYIPGDDVNIGLLERTKRETHCPFKGKTAYWSVVTEAARLENAVWSYVAVYDEGVPLKDLMAFDGTAVDTIAVTPL